MDGFLPLSSAKSCTEQAQPTFHTKYTYSLSRPISLQPQEERNAPHSRESQVSTTQPKSISVGAACWEGGSAPGPPDLCLAKPPRVAALK